jgi:hypothetical protein
MAPVDRAACALLVKCPHSRRHGPKQSGCTLRVCSVYIREMDCEPTTVTFIHLAVLFTYEVYKYIKSNSPLLTQPSATSVRIRAYLSDTYLP